MIMLYKKTYSLLILFSFCGQIALINKAIAIDTPYFRLEIGGDGINHSILQAFDILVAHQMGVKSGWLKDHSPDGLFFIGSRLVFDSYDLRLRAGYQTGSSYSISTAIGTIHLLNLEHIHSSTYGDFYFGTGLTYFSDFKEYSDYENKILVRGNSASSNSLFIGFEVKTEPIVLQFGLQQDLDLTIKGKYYDSSLSTSSRSSVNKSLNSMRTVFDDKVYKTGFYSNISFLF